MRGMIKWKPFNTLLKDSDIKSLASKKEIIMKPIISEDRIAEINYNLETAFTEKLLIKIKYWNIDKLISIEGIIEKINTNEKYILINKSRMYFKDIINITIIDYSY